MDEINRILSRNPYSDLKPLTASELLQSKVDAINTSLGELKYIDCPVCKNKGFVAGVQDGEIIYTRCECDIKRHNIQYIEQSGLKDLLERYTFDAYETQNGWQDKAKAAALDYLKNRTGWFVISGTPGSGKTHLCTAICGELLNANIPVRYFRWRSDAPRLKACVNDAESYAEMITPLKSARCLYIDDFFKGTVTDADKNLAFDLLDTRYNNLKLLTIVSSERSIEEIFEIDKGLGSRMFQRAGEHYVRISGDDKNWRLR